MLTQRALIQSILSGSLDHVREDRNLRPDGQATRLEEEEAVLIECRKTSMTLIRSVNIIATTLAASPYLLEYGQQLLVAGGYLALTAWRRHLLTLDQKEGPCPSQSQDTKDKNIPRALPSHETPAAILREAAQACDALHRLEMALPAAATLGRVLDSLVDKLRRKLRPYSDVSQAEEVNHPPAPSSDQQQPVLNKHSPLGEHGNDLPADSLSQDQFSTSPTGPVPIPAIPSVVLPHSDGSLANPPSDPHPHPHPTAPTDLRAPNPLEAHLSPSNSPSALAGLGTNTSIPPAASHLHALAGDAGVGLHLAPSGLQTWNEMVQDSLGSADFFSDSPLNAPGGTPLRLEQVVNDGDLLPLTYTYGWEMSLQPPSMEQAAPAPTPAPHLELELELEQAQQNPRLPHNPAPLPSHPDGSARMGQGMDSNRPGRPRFL